jgi:hypothetical protein
MVKVIAHDWKFVDYDASDFVRGLPLFISRVLAVSKHGRQFICWFDHETNTWDLDHAAPLVEGDRIIAWTQIDLPKLSDE